jgi:hypothetical protein
MAYVLKLVDENFMSGTTSSKYTPTQWPTRIGAEVVCKDYKPTSECGHGFHGYLNGEGDLGYTSYRGNALILEVDAWIDLGGKVKFEKATVVAFGSVVEMTSKLRQLVGPDKAITLSSVIVGDRAMLLAGSYSNLEAGHDSTLKAGDYSTLEAGSDSTLCAGDDSNLEAGSDSTLCAGDDSNLEAGDGSTLEAGDGSTLEAGRHSTLCAGSDSTLKARYGSTLKAGDGSTLTLRGSIGYVVKSGKHCSLTQHFSGKVKVFTLDSALRRFKAGDKIKIENGKVVGKV